MKNTNTNFIDVILRLLIIISNCFSIFYFCFLHRVYLDESYRHCYAYQLSISTNDISECLAYSSIFAYITFEFVIALLSILFLIVQIVLEFMNKCSLSRNYNLLKIQNVLLIWTFLGFTYMLSTRHLTKSNMIYEYQLSKRINNYIFSSIASIYNLLVAIGFVSRTINLKKKLQLELQISDM